jgi:membrane protein DedA with SNARE-associated domain
MTQSLIDALTSHGLIIVFVTMIAESACIPIPSEVVVPFGGLLAAEGHTHLWMVIAVATVANLIGATIAYVVGLYGGRALFVRYGKYVGVRKHHIEKADRYFERRGDVTVFFTRMMPGVRTFISLPAGIAKMPVVKFLVYTLLGSIPWNIGLAYLGYGAGKAAGGEKASWANLQAQFDRYDKIFYVVLAVVVVALVGWAVWRWRKGRTRAAEGGSGQTSAQPAVPTVEPTEDPED